MSLFTSPYNLHGLVLIKYCEMLGEQGQKRKHECEKVIYSVPEGGIYLRRREHIALPFAIIKGIYR